MKPIRKLADWCVPRSALTNWIVPLRRIDPVKNTFPERRRPEFDMLGNIGIFVGEGITLSELVPVDEIYHAPYSTGITMHPLRWHGGLTPWKP